MRSKRLESDDRRSVRWRFRDVVVGRLPLSATTRNELEEIAVELQHEVRRERHVGEIRVDGAQDIAIAGDLLFGAVHGLGAFCDEIADALWRCDDTFDSVRGLGALNHRVFAQRLKHLGRLLLEQRLFATVLPDEPHALQQALTESLSV